MTEEDMLKKRLKELMELEEERLMVGFHQGVYKQEQKAWHDHHI